MDIRQLSQTFFVSPQIDPADMAHLAQAGISRILCNRPDGEIPPSHQAAAIRAAAEAAGIEFVEQPLTHQTMNAANVARNAALAAGASGGVLAYCASGTRSCIAWCLAEAGKLGVDTVLNAAAKAGYDLEGMRPTLQALTQDQ